MAHTLPPIAKEALARARGVVEERAQRAAERMAQNPRVQRVAIQLRDQLDTIIHETGAEHRDNLEILDGEVIAEHPDPQR